MLKTIHRRTAAEFLRFGLVGIVATAIHYACYCLLQQTIGVGLAYTLGYAVSLGVNFVLTAIFTFRTNATLGRGAGFVLAHLFNYLLQMALLYIVLRLGIRRTWAPVPVYCIAVPVNFLMVRFVFKRMKR